MGFSLIRLSLNVFVKQWSNTFLQNVWSSAIVFSW